jgi:hypothetical protein
MASGSRPVPADRTPGLGREHHHRAFSRYSSAKRGAALATTRSTLAKFADVDPIWPEPIPGSANLRLAYGVDADELVVHFTNVSPESAIVEFIATPEADYAAVKVDPATGEVTGVLVYPLAALAVARHPAWRPALSPSPPALIAGRIVNDIKRLYDRYGLTQESAA